MLGPGPATGAAQPVVGRSPDVQRPGCLAPHTDSHEPLLGDLLGRTDRTPPFPAVPTGLELVPLAAACDAVEHLQSFLGTGLGTFRQPSSQRCQFTGQPQVPQEGLLLHLSSAFLRCFQQAWQQSTCSPWTTSSSVQSSQIQSLQYPQLAKEMRFFEEQQSHSRPLTSSPSNRNHQFLELSPRDLPPRRARLGVPSGRRAERCVLHR